MVGGVDDTRGLDVANVPSKHAQRIALDADGAEVTRVAGAIDYETVAD